MSKRKGHSPQAIIAELLRIYEATKNLTAREILNSRSNHLKTFFYRLDELAALEVDDQSVQEEVVGKLGELGQLGEPAQNSVLAAVVRFRNLYSLRLEIAEAERVLASREPWELLKNFAYFPNYIQLARTEFQGAGLKPGDRVLFLGSGPLPLSLIVLCARYGLQGVGIERERERAELSRRVLARLGLSGQVEILEGDHFSLPLKERSELVLVAAAAEPKREIFDHLAAVLPAGTKVSYRVYEKGLRRLLETPSASGSALELPDRFKEYFRVRPEPPVNNTVVFLTLSP